MSIDVLLASKVVKRIDIYSSSELYVHCKHLKRKR